jgi:hypothetical protein
MTSKINIIKNNKFILRDYVALINEIIHQIEKDSDLVNNNIVITLNKYKDMFRKYLQNDFTTDEINDNDLEYIYTYAITLPDELKLYPSIFNENIYFDVIKNLKEISLILLNKRSINDDIYSYIEDYLNNTNNFDIWKILFSKCVYILFNNKIRILNEYSPLYYSTIEDFNDSINLQELPIYEWPFKSNHPEYVEYVEVLYSYYDSEYCNYNVNPLYFNDDDDDDDDVDVVEEEPIFIINFKKVFNELNVYLYNNGCLSTKLFNYMFNSIEQANLSDLEINIYMRERYNALCYLYIKKINRRI